MLDTNHIDVIHYRCIRVSEPAPHEQPHLATIVETPADTPQDLTLTQKIEALLDTPPTP